MQKTAVNRQPHCIDIYSALYLFYKIIIYFFFIYPALQWDYLTNSLQIIYMNMSMRPLYDRRKLTKGNNNFSLNPLQSCDICSALYLFLFISVRQIQLGSVYLQLQMMRLNKRIDKAFFVTIF